MIEEHENQETSLQDLIDLVERDDLPTNEFTTEDKDPMVILGKLNEVIAYLQTLQATINASDSKANEALQRAIQAVANAIEAVGTANTALSASNTALSTANTAISTANTALSSANDAVETATTLGSEANNKADNAVTQANEALRVAQEALDQVVSELGTKVYRDTLLLNSLNIKPIENDIADNTTAITALQSGKVDKVTGKQLSTEDFTTAEKNKLAGLNNYDDTQVQADITALQIRATNIETKNAEQDNSIANINNKIYPIGSIYITTSQASPASIYGGTWELIKDRFLLGAGDTYTNGATGGEATHTLTVDEMPSHSHTVYTFPYGGSESGYYCVSSNPGGNVNPDIAWGGGYTNSVGGGQAHNNMPPYLVVYMWKRIS